MVPHGTDPDYLPVSVQESLVEAWVSGDLLQGQGHECSSACMGPFEGGSHYLHYLHHSLASGQTTGWESPLTENWITDLLIMAPMLIKKQICYSVNKGPSSQDYGFFSSHVWM